jgi:hypothetical protein
MREEIFDKPKPEPAFYGLNHLRDFFVVVTAAAMIRTKHEGILGVLVVAPQGSGKSEMIMAAAERFKWRVLTEATKGGINKVLVEVASFKGITADGVPIIAIPELHTMISGTRRARDLPGFLNAMLAEGFVEKKTEVPDKYDIKSMDGPAKASIVMACVPNAFQEREFKKAIRNTGLSSRLLYYYFTYAPSDRKRILKRIAAMAGDAGSIETEPVFGEYTLHKKAFISEEVKARVNAMAMRLAKFKSCLYGDPVEPLPTRENYQILSLLRGLSAIHGRIDLDNINKLIAFFPFFKPNKPGTELHYRIILELSSPMNNIELNKKIISYGYTHAEYAEAMKDLMDEYRLVKPYMVGGQTMLTLTDFSEEVI